MVDKLSPRCRNSLAIRDQFNMGDRLRASRAWPNEFILITLSVSCISNEARELVVHMFNGNID